jgi:hypothetical protein
MRDFLGCGLRGVEVAQCMMYGWLNASNVKIPQNLDRLQCHNRSVAWVSPWACIVLVEIMYVKIVI